MSDVGLSSWLRGASNGRQVWVLALVGMFAGAAVGFAVVDGPLKSQLLLAGAVLAGVGYIYPRVIMWLIVILTVCFSETRYGIESPSAFRLGSYVLDPFRLNIYELLVYLLFAILLTRRFTRGPRVALPKVIVVPSAIFACVFAFQLMRAQLGGTPYEEIMVPPNGRYVLAGVVALWCFSQLLSTPKTRLRLLDVLFVLATGRAAYGLVGYFLGLGDAANAYREVGVKVALWESADHMLFVLLIVVAISGWALKRLTRPRVPLWILSSTVMSLTIVLSFRRTGWLGLAAALTIAVALLARRSTRAVALVPAILAVTAGILSISYRRFAGAGSLLTRLFPDITSTGGPTRQDEWALAWKTIVQNPIAGDMTARRVGSRWAFWDTRIVHNAVLFAWMKFGLLGLLALTSLTLACGGYAFKGVRSRCSEEHVALGVVGIAPFVLLVTITGGPLSEMRMMLVLALAGSLGVLVGMRGGVMAKVAPSPSASAAAERGPEGSE